MIVQSFEVTAPVSAGRTDRYCALALAAVDGALAQKPLVLAGDRTAIVVGTAFGSYATNEEYYRRMLSEGASPRLFAATLPSSPAGEISIRHAITGPAITFASGGAAWLDAFAQAHQLIASGRADRALCVAIDAVTSHADASDVAVAFILENADALRGYGKCFGQTARERAVAQATRAGRPSVELSSPRALANFFATGSGDVLAIAIDGESVSAAVITAAGVV